MLFEQCQMYRMTRTNWFSGLYGKARLCAGFFCTLLALASSVVFRCPTNVIALGGCSKKGGRETTRYKKECDSATVSRNRADSASVLEVQLVNTSLTSLQGLGFNVDRHGGPCRITDGKTDGVEALIDTSAHIEHALYKG